MFSPIPGKVIQLHETDGKRVEPVRYAVGKETLDTPMGKLETIVLTKQLPKDGNEDEKWRARQENMAGRGSSHAAGTHHFPRENGYRDGPDGHKDKLWGTGR